MFYNYNEDMRRTYYLLKNTIQPGWTLPHPSFLISKKGRITGEMGGAIPHPERWKSPPHVFFANLGYRHRFATVEEISQFLRLYGPLFIDSVDSNTFEVSVEEFGHRQETVRHAWRRRDAKGLWFAEGFENLDQFDLRLFWDKGDIALRPADCWTYMCLLLTRDIAEKRARVCANPTCNTPHFVAARNNQIFCKRKCANLVTQRNYRNRARRKR